MTVNNKFKISLSILLFVFGQNTKAQNTIVTLSTSDSVVKAELLSESKKVKVINNRTYHWYASNSIMETVGGYSGKLLNGKYASYYVDNNLKQQGNFYKGLINGVWKSWYQNGKLREIITWKKGLRNGKAQWFNEKGEKTGNASFKNDKLIIEDSSSGKKSKWLFWKNSENPPGKNKDKSKEKVK